MTEAEYVYHQKGMYNDRIILNDLDMWAVISPMMDHSEVRKMPFWMIQRAGSQGFDRYWSLVCWIDLILHIMKALYALEYLSALRDQG